LLAFAAEPQGGDFGSLWWASDLSNVTTSHSHCHRLFLHPKLVLRQSMLSMSDSSSSDYSDEESAIEWLLSQQGNQLLVRVDEDYIEDAFNLYGLNKVIPNFRDTLRLLLTTAEDAEICLEDDHRGPCYQTLLDLYGLIHARYILTTPGMNKLRRKLQNGVYGCCPNYPDQRVLPIGMSDVLGSGPPLGYVVERGEVVQMPNWGDQLDGAYFGTTSTNLFLMLNPGLHGSQGWPVLGTFPTPQPQEYCPRIFGFKVRRLNGTRPIAFDAQAPAPVNQSHGQE